MTQLDMVREALDRGDEITPLDALNRFGCLRLGARIDELKNEGYPIARRMIAVTNRHGKKVRVAAYRRA